MQKIVICSQGWVFVGEVTDTETGLRMENAAVIRRWGTTRGLGQLCLSGPTKETSIDPAGTLSIPRHSVVAIMDVQEGVVIPTK